MRWMYLNYDSTVVVLVTQPILEDSAFEEVVRVRALGHD